MNLMIVLTPSEEALLCEAAKQTGLAPAELAKKVVTDHLVPVPATGNDDLDAKLCKWQVQDGTMLMRDIPTQTLFAQWAEEDRHMTDEERQAEDLLWEDLEKGFPDNGRALQLRRLG